MAAVRESRLWSWLGEARYQRRGLLHMTRVENSIGMGMPDVEGCIDGAAFWLELKCATRPVRTSTPIKVRFEPSQLPWLKRRWVAGGPAFVLLQVGQGRSASRYLVPGNLAHRMEEGLSEEAIRELSVIDPQATAVQIVVRASTPI